MLGNVMYMIDRLRAPNLPGCDKNKIQIQSEHSESRKRSQVSYLEFLKDIEGNADGGRIDEVSFARLLPAHLSCTSHYISNCWNTLPGSRSWEVVGYGVERAWSRTNLGLIPSSTIFQLSDMKQFTS